MATSLISWNSCWGTFCSSSRSYIKIQQFYFFTVGCREMWILLSSEVDTCQHVNVVTRAKQIKRLFAVSEGALIQKWKELFPIPKGELQQWRNQPMLCPGGEATLCASSISSLPLPPLTCPHATPGCVSEMQDGKGGQVAELLTSSRGEASCCHLPPAPGVQCLLGRKHRMTQESFLQVPATIDFRFHEECRVQYKAMRLSSGMD